MKSTYYKSLILKKISYLMLVVFLFSIVPINANATSEINENTNQSSGVNSSTISINKVTPDATTISGFAKGASSVDIYIDEENLGNFQVASDGSFKVNIPFSIKESKNIKVVSKDSLGFIVGTKTISISDLSAPTIISLSDEESISITIGGDPDIGYIVGQADPNCIIEFNFTFNGEIEYTSTANSDEEGLFYITYDYMGGCDVSIIAKDIENTQSKTLNLTAQEWDTLVTNKTNYIITDEIGFGTERDSTGLTTEEIVKAGYTITAYDEDNNIIAERIARPNDGLYTFEGVEYDDNPKMPLAAPQNSIVRIVLVTNNEVKYDKTGVWPTDFDYDLISNGMGLMYIQEARLLKYNMIKQWSKYFFVNKLYNEENISYEDWANKEEDLLPLPIELELEYPEALDIEKDVYSPNPFEIKLKVKNTTGTYFEKMAFSFNLTEDLIPLKLELLNQEILNVFPGEMREIVLKVKLKDKKVSKFDKDITFEVTPNIEEFSSGYDTSPLKGSIYVPGTIDDDFESENNNTQNANNITFNNDDSEGIDAIQSKISYSGDVDWWKFEVKEPSTFRILLGLPKEEDKQVQNTNYNLELYDHALNKIAFTTDEYDTKFINHTIKDSTVSEENPKTFYIKVIGNTYKDFNAEYKYILYSAKTSQEGGKEVMGWDYATYKYPISDTPLRLYFDESCKEEGSSKYETYGRESIKSIVEAGIAKWNYEDKANNKPTTLIEIDENNSTGIAFPIKILNKTGSDNTDLIGYFMIKDRNSEIVKDLEIQLNHKKFKEFGKKDVNSLKATITHELGHALGFKDLYANDIVKYGVDNRDKMMYGKGNFTQGEIHPIEKAALPIIQGWKSKGSSVSYDGESRNYISASYPNYDNEALHAEATVIAKGTVISKEDIYEEDSIPQTKLQFKVDNYYKDLTKDAKDVITVYQDGNTEYPMSGSTLLEEGDEVILYLGSNSHDEYYILGGPQGRYNLTVNDSTYYVLSEIDKQLYLDLSSSGHDVSKITPTDLSIFEKNVEDTLSNIPPEISASIDKEANGNGWFNEDVTVAFKAKDDLHGIKEVTKDITLTSEGANQSVTGTATNNKGVSASITVDNINIDKTKPIIDVTTPSTFKEDDVLKLDFKVEDTLSGIDTLKIKLNDVEYNLGDEVLLSKGNYILEVEAMDLAGNITKKSSKFIVEKRTTEPDITEPEKPNPDGDKEEPDDEGYDGLPETGKAVGSMVMMTMAFILVVTGIVGLKRRHKK